MTETRPMHLDGLLVRVYEEIERQRTLFGDQLGKSAGEWVAVLVEEVGEVCQALLPDDRERSLQRPMWAQDYWTREQLHDELIQVAAVAVHMALALVEPDDEDDV